MEGNEELLTFQRFMLAFDTPAYMRRARTVEAEWRHLLTLSTRERERQLELPKLRLAELMAATDELRRGVEWPPRAAARKSLLDLYRTWQPRLRSQRRLVDAQQSAGLVDRLIVSFESFNRRWEQWLRGLDLGPVNTLRDGYNRHYVLEKECAVRSEATAKEGFEPLPIATWLDLLVEFPQLQVPTAAGDLRVPSSGGRSPLVPSAPESRR